MSDHDAEYVRGLPEELPDGERILWQGTPRWTALARSAFHTRGLSIYFAALLLLRALTVLWSGGAVEHAVVAVLWLIPLAAAGVGMMMLVAWLTARATVYTITNRRVVMRIGIVLEITLNFPFHVIESAGLRADADGTGDIPLVLSGDDRIAFVHLWPHTRPWRLERPEPMMRSIPDAAHAASILANALAAYCGAPARPVAIASDPVPAPMTESRPLATATH